MQTRVGGVAVSLPDATRSDRVYPLLQNLDLENLAFATVQGVGNTLNIEELNEDELRRLVLVNLARLTVAGEWNGLLTAGGTPAFNYIIPDPSALTGGTYYAQIPFATPYASTGSVSYEVPWDSPFYIPFVSPKSGDLASITLDVQSAQAGEDVDIGIYSTTSGGIPSALLGKATIDMDATGEVTQSSLSATITLEAGTSYYMAWVRSTGSSTAPGLYSMQSGNGPIGVSTALANQQTVLATDYGGTSQALPASPAASDFIAVARTKVPIVGLKW